MKFATRLWTMTKNNQAIMVKHEGTNVCIVPTGKWAGEWYFKNKKCHYKMLPLEGVLHSFPVSSSDDYNDEAGSAQHFHSAGDSITRREQQFPLPGFIYQVFEEKKSPGVAHAMHQHKLGWIVSKWKMMNMPALIQTQADMKALLNPSAQEAEDVSEYLKRNNINDGIKMMVRYNLPLLLKNVSMNKGRALQIVQDLGRAEQLLHKMGVHKRWNFINNIWSIGLLRAMRKSFPRTNRRLLNSYLEDKTGNFNRDGARLLPGEYNNNTWRDIRDYENYKDHGLDRDHFLYLKRSYPMGHAFESGNSRFQPTAGMLGIYASELKDARQLGCILPDVWQTADKISIPEAHRRHEIIIDVIRQYRLLKEDHLCVSSAAAQTANWKDLKYPDTWRPLITAVDFDAEGKHMHHCIGNYKHQVGSIFAHIDFVGTIGLIEEASLMMDISGLKNKPSERKLTLTQLYGMCNAEVSGALRNHVMNWMRETLKK